VTYLEADRGFSPGFVEADWMLRLIMLTFDVRVCCGGFFIIDEMDASLLFSSSFAPNAN